MKARASTSLTFVATIVLGCGSEPGAEPIPVEWDPPSIAMSTRQGDYTEVYSDAYLATPICDGVIPQVEGEGIGLSSDGVGFSGPPVSHFMVSSSVDATLPPGTYRGRLRLRLFRCADSCCCAMGGEIPLSTASVPYTLTVTPGFTVSVAVDGVPEPTPSVHAEVTRLWVRTGQTVSLVANRPMTWSTQSQDGKVSSEQLDATHWSGAILLDEGAGYGQVTVLATPVEDPDVPIWIVLLVAGQ